MEQIAATDVNHAVLRRLNRAHYTPIHGSWLNMVEIEISALTKQCLDRRLPDAATLRSEVAAWLALRNEKAVPINWQFTNTTARRKLEDIYPSIDG